MQIDCRPAIPDEYKSTFDEMLAEMKTLGIQGSGAEIAAMLALKAAIKVEQAKSRKGDARPCECE